MLKRLVSIHAFQVQMIRSNGTSVERVGDFFIAKTPDTMNVSRDIREAVTVLENRSLAAKSIKAFSMSRVTYKAAVRLFSAKFRIEILKEKPTHSLPIEEILTMEDKSPQTTEVR